MTRVLVTGGSGLVGRFIVEDLFSHGYDVTVAGRTAPAPDLFSAPVQFVPLTLNPKADFGTAVAGCDCLIHAAFAHVPGRYRSGEGDDAPGFWRANFLSTLLLFQAAAQAGMERGVFLSSRAVYGVQSPGAVLTEKTDCHPDTHYGAVKHACERHLGALSAKGGLAVASLRATGVYGSLQPGEAHKWSDLFNDYLNGNPVEPRCGTEVHGRDVAAATRLMLELPEAEIAGEAFNVSDLFLDRRDLLALVREHTGCSHSLPAEADKSSYNIASTAKLAALGWQPGGVALLQSEIERLLERVLLK
ncbi:NAD-dependent epimerase/dehydratase family protein [Hoeflea sp. TYP-13]|uniref:NAD-dependent epimerase/dehydratase family protein n=1 Tax=Hoeflea sp. TYP-13 TaxID=3230023 RepID=UPI0034C67A9B